MYTCSAERAGLRRFLEIEAPDKGVTGAGRIRGVDDDRMQAFA